MSQAHRLALIKENTDTLKASILEIGALDQPTFRPPDHKVSYADLASRKELAAKGGNNPRYKYERLVDVDYVIKDGDYAKSIGRTFDLIIANHVIEHVPNAIDFLGDMGKLLTPKGVLFLTVPDKRYTFDITRRLTNFIDLLRAQRNRQTKPDFFNILEHFWHHKAVSAKDIWENKHHEAMAKQRFKHKDALDTAEHYAKEDYADVHCHVFTDSSFNELLTDLQGFGLLPFSHWRISPVRYMSNEFYVALHKQSRK